MRRDLFEDFCREYVRELNRLRMEHRAGLSSARSELGAVEREIRKLVQAIKDGVSALSIKDELPSLEARKAVEGRPGGNAERGQRQQEVARYRRPHGPNKVGCGGSQPPIPMADSWTVAA